MSHDSPRGAGLPPWWLVLPASALILVHLGIVICHALAAPSGPWVTDAGPQWYSPPQFAYLVAEATHPLYGDGLKLNQRFRYPSTRPDLPGARLEVRIQDEKGATTRTVRLPDPDANPWVRYRQTILAREVYDDQPIPPPAGEVIPAPGQVAPRTLIWEERPNRELVLQEIPVHLVPRDRPNMRPTPWSVLLARAYARRVERTLQAPKVDVVRITKQPIYPAILDNPSLPMPTEPLIASFGEKAR